MKKPLLITLVSVGAFALFISILCFWGIGTRNQANTLRETITAKTQANATVFDNMWKKIAQTAQVTDAQKDALKEVFTSYAQARSGSGQGGSFINAVHEAIPQVDTSSFKNLQNIITGSRDEWTANQIALVDLGREYNTLITTFPSNLFLGSLGFQRIEVKTITSSRTDSAFNTGKDDDVGLGLKSPTVERK